MERDPPPEREPTLPAFLAARARSASDARLAANVAGGLVVVAATLLGRPRGWLLLACAAGVFVAYGAWGMADRELGEIDTDAPRALVATLRAVRTIAAVGGALVALLLLFSALAFAIGRVIS